MSEIGVHITAGGYGTRLREHMNELGYASSYPKHLLPTGGPQGETFLGRVIRQTLQIPNARPPIVYVNEENRQHIQNHPDVQPAPQLCTQSYGNWLEPMIDSLAATKQRVVGCAGDFYASINWLDLLGFHDDSKYPVTFVAGLTVPVERGLVYTVAEDSKVISFKRSDMTSANEMINVGIYVFDPEPRALSVLQHAKQAKEEQIAQALVDEELLGLYVLPTMPFNVNTKETYQMLLEHTVNL